MESSTTPFLSKSEHRLSGSSDDELHDEENIISSSTSVTHRRRRALLTVASHIIIILLAIWGLTSLCLQLVRLTHQQDAVLYKVQDVYRPSTLPPDLNLCDCGTTMASALSKNCIYDSLATAWLPPYCRDDELTFEFDHSGPGPNGSWPYFADKDGQIPISKAEMALLGETKGTFWSPREWHVAHCAFYWQKYVRMRNTGKVMERRFDSLAHVKHCGRLSMNRMPMHGLLIEVNVVMSSGITED